MPVATKPWKQSRHGLHVCCLKTYKTVRQQPKAVAHMFRVRVSKIESIRDIDGNLGKRIELIEDRQIPRFIVRPQSEEAKVVQDVLQQLQQQMPMFSVRTDLAVPKIILFLTEQEYESLGIVFDVNQTYEITLENQTIRFMKAL